jgi:hypothetical protein
MYDAAFLCKDVAAAQTASAALTNDRRMKTERLDARMRRTLKVSSTADSSCPARAITALTQRIHK